MLIFDVLHFYCNDTDTMFYLHVSAFFKTSAAHCNLFLSAEVPVVHVDNETSVYLTTVTEDLINKTIAITDSTGKTDA